MDADAVKRQLGEVPLPAGTVEHDLGIAASYQEFSAELLRLSLAAIAVIGFLLDGLGDWQIGVATEALVRGMTAAAALGCGVAASFALLHRYVATDAVANQVEILRRRVRGSAEDLAEAKRLGGVRDREFCIAQAALVGSCVSLALGALVLGLAFVKALG